MPCKYIISVRVRTLKSIKKNALIDKHIVDVRACRRWIDVRRVGTLSMTSACVMIDKRGCRGNRSETKSKAAVDKKKQKIRFEG